VGKDGVIVDGVNLHPSTIRRTLREGREMPWEKLMAETGPGPEGRGVLRTAKGRGTTLSLNTGGKKDENIKGRGSLRERGKTRSPAAKIASNPLSTMGGGGRGIS